MDDYAIISCATKDSAINISSKINGIINENPNSNFQYEIKIPLSNFDKVMKFNNWDEIINKL
jgi:hypothetical protein